MPGKPPFLFRAASSDGSCGLNTIEEIDPLFGYESDYHRDLTAMLYDTARFMIRDYINYNYQAPSEFSSWSVSLLYVLVHAVRKAYSKDERDVVIYVIDTKTLLSSRLHSAAELVKRYDIGWSQYRKVKNSRLSEYVSGEYLIHGKLANTEGVWQAVNIDELIKAGLWKAFPALRTKTNLLLQRVKGLRHAYITKHDGWSLASGFKAVVGLARCFGPAWEGLMSIAFITLSRRDFSTESVTALIDELKSVKLRQLPWSSDQALRRIRIECSGMSESQQFMQLLRLLHDRQTQYEQDKTAKISEAGASDCS